MLVKLDWLSFSLVWSADNGRGGEYLWQNISAAMDALETPDLPHDLDMAEVSWTRELGRAPYQESFVHPTSKIRIYVHPALNHCLIEVSGTGCDWLYKRGVLLRTLSAVRNRLTRIDVACDILTDVRPLAFATDRTIKRFKAYSHHQSDTGETVYIGSRTSNRYVRVYRYAPPHERAPFLRVEFVVKGKDARMMAGTVLGDGAESVAEALKLKFGFTHPIWDSNNVTPAELEAYRPDRKEGKTVVWLNNTIAPLIARLHKKGVIDAISWLEENVLPKLSEGK